MMKCSGKHKVIPKPRPVEGLTPAQKLPLGPDPFRELERYSSCQVSVCSSANEGTGFDALQAQYENQI